MSKKKSFVSQFSPYRDKTRPYEWPFPVAEGESAPRLMMRVLGADQLEAAQLATISHFSAIAKDARDAKQPVVNVKVGDEAFDAREKIEQIFRAFYVENDGRPIADTADELQLEPADLLGELHRARVEFQAEQTMRPLTKAELEDFVDELKKKPHSVLLDALPSTWLRQLVRGLAAPPASSTTASGSGSQP